MKEGAMLGTAALALVALVYAQMLVALRRIEGVPQPAAESTPPSVWWFGYARDGVNMFGFLSFSGGFGIAGMDGPTACLAGASFTLVGYGLDYFLARRLPPESAPTVFRILLVAMAAGLSALQQPIGRGLRAFVQVMF
jgi:hypothetical protein